MFKDPTKTEPKASKYTQRMYYDWTMISDELNNQTTGHFIGEISTDTFYPESHKREGIVKWMEEED